VLAACSSEPETAERQPPEVTVDTPDVETVTEYLFYEGNLEAVSTSRIRARVPGFLEQVAFRESSQVERGQLLFVIEPEPYRVAVQQAEAAVARARAEAEADRVRAQLVGEAFEQGAATELERVEAQATLAIAEAAVTEAEAALQDARLRLSYTEVRSPIDGRIDRNYVDIGNLVGAGEQTLLATVVSDGRMHVVFEASERIVLRYIARGDSGDVGEPGGEVPPVEVGRLVDEGYPFVGQVDYVDNIVDPATGTLTVRATIEDPEDQLIPGLFARIRAPFQELEDGILVDENAVQTGLEGRYVLVVGEDDIVQRRRVEVGGRYDTRLLVRSGLGPEDRYIVSGIQRARPGLPVRPTMRSDAPASDDASSEDASSDADADAAPADG